MHILCALYCLISGAMNEKATNHAFHISPTTFYKESKLWLSTRSDVKEPSQMDLDFRNKIISGKHETNLTMSELLFLTIFVFFISKIIFTHLILWWFVFYSTSSFATSFLMAMNHKKQGQFAADFSTNTWFSYFRLNYSVLLFWWKLRAITRSS